MNLFNYQNYSNADVVYCVSCVVLHYCEKVRRLFFTNLTEKHHQLEQYCIGRTDLMRNFQFYPDPQQWRVLEWPPRSLDLSVNNF